MFLEKRPTCVTVIGWAWIVIGGLMVFSALFAAASMMSMDLSSDSDAPLFFKLFPVFVVAQLVGGSLGIVGGTQLLKLKAWARGLLEVLTWLLLLAVVGFMIYWFSSFFSMTAQLAPRGFDLISGLMGLLITAIYVVPLVIMVRYLRGPKVRGAMAGTDAALEGEGI